MTDIISSTMIVQPALPYEVVQVKPYSPLSLFPEPAITTAEHWVQTTTPIFSRLLTTTSYSPALQAQYRSFLHDRVVPSLGPLRSASKWKPNITHTNVPFEPSLNIQPRSSKSQVRFCFEPVGLQAGTSSDPFNQSSSLTFVSSLAASKICPDLNTEWWNHFTRELFIPGPAVDGLRANMPPQMAAPTCFLAFDLPNTKFAPVMKPYLFPHRQALLTRQTTTAVILAAVHKLDAPILNLGPALKKVESLLAGRPAPQRPMGPPAGGPPGNSPSGMARPGAGNPRADMSGSGGIPLALTASKGISLEMLSFDAIDFAKSRIKMYARTTCTDFANTAEVWTMDGQRPDDKGVEALKQFWDAFFPGPTATSPTGKPAFLFFTLEIAPNNPEVDLKLYIPCWVTGLGSELITQRLIGYFRALGWGVEKEMGLVDLIACDQADGGGASYTYISFAYSEKKGPYVTLYYAPQPLSC